MEKIQPINVVSIDNIDGYKVTLTFNNGESGTIDFYQFFSEGLNENSIERVFLENPKVFEGIEIVHGHTIGWRNVIIIVDSEINKRVEYHFYDLDPEVLYNFKTKKREEVF